MATDWNPNNKDFLAGRKAAGTTLFELLFSLSVMAILMTLALPAFGYFLDKRKIIAESQQLRGTLQLARKTAITLRQKVTVCPTLDHLRCSDSWSDGYMVFVDLNADRQLDANDSLVRVASIGDDEIRLRWRAFGVRSSMQWHHTGITNHQNGSFEFCFKDDPTLSRALIIAKAGRIRVSKDENGDGIHENSVGENINC